MQFANFPVKLRSYVFLGFTGTFFSNSEWGSTQNVLMIVGQHKVKTYSENFFQSDDNASIWS